MSQSKIRVESFDRDNKILRVSPTDTFDFNVDAALMYQTILRLLKIDHLKLIIDLQNVPYPTTSFIGFMIEVSSVLRREGGEFNLINLSDSARSNFISFSPFSFINVLESESDLSALMSQPAKVYQDPVDQRAEADEKILYSGVSDSEEEFSIREIVDPNGSSEKSESSLDKKAANFDFAELVDEKVPEIKEVRTEKIVVKSREDQLYKLTDFVAIHAENAHFDHTEISRMKISVYEAAHNIIEHAYKFDSTKYIEMSLKYDQQKFTINLMDKGLSFDYDPNRNYDALEAAEERRTGGFGLHIIRRSMDDVRYESNPIWGNRLTLVKNIH